MKKYFTKDIAQPLKVIVLGLALGLGVSIVSANWTPPPATAPGCPTNQNVAGCDAPVNVSSAFQQKDGTSDTAWTLDVKGKVTGNILGAMDAIKVGSSNHISQPNANMIYGNLNLKQGMLNVDVTGYTGNGADGRNAISLAGNTGNNSVGIIQNKPNFFIYDYVNGTGATIQAKKVQLNDGTQGVGKLLSSDANGLSSWVNEPTLVTQPMTVPNSFVPDIVMVEEDWSGLHDNNSNDDNPLACPANYAAIAVSCRSSADGGVDDCYLTPDNNGNTGPDVGQQFNWAQSAAAGKYHAAVASPAGNGNMHIVLTCMRYTNFNMTTKNVGVALLGGSTHWQKVTGTQGNNFTFARGNDGESCASFLGVPADQGRIQMRIGTTVVYTDKCAYKGTFNSYAVHDADYANNAVAPYAENSPGAGNVSFNGNVYETWVLK